MKNKRIIIGIVLIFTLALQIGCSGNGEIPINDQENGHGKEIMDEFNALVENDTELDKVIGFIDQNISALSKENAATMINKLEELQKKNLPKLEEEYYTDSNLQNKMLHLYQSKFDINEINNSDDEALKGLLTETKENGYKIETAEGMFFPIIDYGIYKNYRSYATPDLEHYIDIMVIESTNVPAKDGALVIGWDEVLDRAMNQEEFMSQYPDSVKIDDVKKLYTKYVGFALFGLNNTPLFSYDSKTMVEEAKSVYEEGVKRNEDSEILEIIKEYLDVIEENDYKLTDEIETYRRGILENIG